MGFSILQSNLGGVSVNSLLNPLSDLVNPTKIDNLIYPSDLGANPAMGHAVVFTIYDRKTGLSTSTQQAVTSLTPVVTNAISSIGGATSSGTALITASRLRKFASKGPQRAGAGLLIAFVIF